MLAVGVLGLAFAIASLVDRTAARPLGVVFPALAALVPATFLTAGSILAVDHFTYTVLGFGVISSRGGPRVLYGLLMLATCVAADLVLRRLLALRARAQDGPAEG